MTVRFVSAADLMRRVLGMPGHDFAVIEHPISSATDDDLRKMADLTITQVRRFLLRP